MFKHTCFNLLFLNFEKIRANFFFKSTTKTNIKLVNFTSAKYKIISQTIDAVTHVTFFLIFNYLV